MKSRAFAALPVLALLLALAPASRADDPPPAPVAPTETPAAVPGETPDSQAPSRVDSKFTSAQIKELEARVAADSAELQPHFDLGNAYYDQGRLNEALIQFNKVVAMDSTYWKAWVNIGTVNDELSKTSLATNAFNKAIRLQPRDTFAYVKLANSSYAHGDVATAMDNYRLALSIDPKCLEAHFMLGNAFAEQEMYRQAVREWKTVQFHGGSSAAESKLAEDNLETVYAFFAEEPTFLAGLKAIQAGAPRPPAEHKRRPAPAKPSGKKAAPRKTTPKH